LKVENPKYQVGLTLSRICVAWLIAFTIPFAVSAQQQDTTQVAPDTVRSEPYEPSSRPSFAPTDRYGDPFSSTPYETPLFLEGPSRLELEIDTALNYSIREKIGDVDYRPATTMSFEEFRQYQERQMLKEYWQTRARALDGESAVSGRGFTPKIFISPVLDRIFGGSYIELIPRGFVTLDFGAAFQRINNPAIPIRQQRNGGFEFDQQINMNVTGKIGEKLSVIANFDNNNSFDFQNNMKVEYTGFKEDILKKLEIGNVSLPLNNTLIQGAQNLFGVKGQMQFGKLNVTAIASTQRGKTSSIEIPGGNSGQGRPFEIIASNYDENRHFFLGHFFRDNYRRWIAIPPQITSGVNVTRVEVYILNRNNDTQTLRNVVGLMDLGEGTRVYNPNVQGRVPGSPNTNEANDLFSFVTGLNRADTIDSQLAVKGLANGTDYEKITGARKLAPTEYTFHSQLGYITLTRKLQNDEALAVAYEYTYNGRVFKVGELSEDYSNLKDSEVVFLKLLRPRKIAIRDQQNVIVPTWDLMMKNIYTLNVNQLSPEGFQLRVIYRDDRTGIDNPQLQEGQFVRNRQLIEVFGLDKLNPVNDPQRDGNFDFIEGITIETQTGLIIFPYLEPFSEALKEAFQPEPNRDLLIQKYSYDTLYRTTKAEAELFSTKNKFFLIGQYSAGSSKEILIPGFGVAQGSVKVFAGGIPLIENSQFTVDYTFGKVTILDESILNSGKNISIQYEQSDPFAFQTRTLLGTRFDYTVNDDINIGSTVLYYNERPLISRNQIGTEPARNLMYGVDFNVNKQSRLLTKLVDAIPILQTKEQSSVNFSGEFAQLLPGTSNVIDGEGTAYLDDFENTATPYSLMSPQGWKLASIPQTEDSRFDPSNGANDVEAGYRRAKLAWYMVDNLFYRQTGGAVSKPSGIPDEISKHYERPIQPQEIFPNRNREQAVFQEPIFDVAYYPAERGPYNFNPNLNNNGFFTNPRENFGAITNAIRTEVDFDKANIEYVEFWMMDPFISGTNGQIDDGINPQRNNTTGGKLIFQLGSISEDVMRDGKHAFENGLPADGNLATGAIENSWGYVTSQQYITNAFDNSSEARSNQDVGLDGISNDVELIKFDDFLNSTSGLSPAAQDRIRLDPSADDFKYFLSSEFEENAQILERYKHFNGLDGNTPISGNDVVARSGSPYPDNEDLNADNTLSELEEYYEYDIDLRKDQLRIGSEYIVDKIDSTIYDDRVTWYLFRIPVREFENKFGNISGFKSIRYVRMVLTDFAEPVVLRFANFRMIGSRWRRYNGQLWEAGLIETPEPNLDNFAVSVVNLEDNGEADLESNKSPYRIPPGVLRDRDNTSTITRFLNEQSVQFCVDNLLDGDARAIYKNFEADLFNYGRIKMFLHADSESEDDDLSAFIRIGTDFDQNYYEIEIPLKVSRITNPGNPDIREVWPEENEIDLDLNELTALKVRRDREGFPLSEVYDRPEPVGRHQVRILGRPDLSSVRLIMIGVRNPRTDDKRSHSACVWANELRLTDFDRTPGWAVNATLSAKLADFATVTGAFRHTTFGFGSVSSKIAERTRDETTSYDVAANVNVDKLLPGNSGIKIPMFVSYEKNISNPKYDPANPDVRLDATLRSFGSSEERDDYVALIRDQSVRRSLNFTNVRKVKVRPDAKSHIYDIENLSFSYAYSEARRTNFNIKEQLHQQHRASVAYNFAPKATGIEPFRNSKGLNSPYLRLIKDFNIGLLPSNIGVRADLDRSFSKYIYRNDGGLGDFSNFQKYFIFNRTYNLRWALSKGLTFDYNARANAVIDEPEGEINTEEKRDEVISNLKKFGRMKNFDQSVTVNYTLPLDKIPLVDWLRSEYRYQASYNWRAGPLNKPDSITIQTGEQDIPDSLDFRNTIQNSREQNFSGGLDLVKLYNKSKFLKEINTPPRPTTTTRTNTAGRTQPQVEPDTTKKTPSAVRGLLRLLMSLRSVNGTYTKNEGTILPGFNRSPWLFGMDRDFDSPGWGFVLGDQDPNVRFKAAESNWLVDSRSLTIPFTQRKSTSIDLRANVEPTPDLRITIEVKKDAMSAYQEIFRFDPDNPAANEFGYASLNPSRSGSYKISTMAISTAFNSDNDDKESTVFHDFENNLEIIRSRFASITGQPEFDTASQDVLIPAFIAAYTGKDPGSISLSPFPNTPLPNWRVEYTGLGKLPGLRDAFQMVSITHAYTSAYSVINYSNSLQYSDPDNLSLTVPIEDYNRKYFGINTDGQAVPVYVISQVLISEQFAPLLGINLRTKSRIIAKLEYRTKRDLALNISNAQVSELNTKDVAFELGYTKNNMKLPFKSQGRTIVLKNDVTFRLNLTVSDTRTIQRKIGEPGTVTNGNINFQLRPNINYALNEKLNVQAYFERTVNEPMISSSYRRSTTRFGIQVRFNLAQ
jgi:cell surface protein SprA